VLGQEVDAVHAGGTIKLPNKPNYEIFLTGKQTSMDRRDMKYMKKRQESFTELTECERHLNTAS